MNTICRCELCGQVHDLQDDECPRIPEPIGKPPEQQEFTCPKCGGHWFGSEVYMDANGIPQVGQKVYCHSIIDNINPNGKAKRCQWIGTRDQAGL